MAKIYNETWPLKKKITDEVIRDRDFSLINLNEPIFKGVHFIDCLFNETWFGDTRLYSCNFTNCTFIKVNLRDTTVGAHGGIYENCVFRQCDFRKGCFYKPELINCFFDDCKLKGVDFKASSFRKCKFSGKLDDVIFHGNYIGPTTEGASPNLMTEVDFSESIWSSYVCFDNCDLTTCIPPDGHTFEELLSPSPYMKDANYLCTNDPVDNRE